MRPGFRAGLRFWFAGWRFIFSDGKLLAVAFVPILLSLTGAGVLIWLLLNYIPAWVSGLVASVGGASSGFLYDLMYYPLVVGGGLIAFVASLYVVYVSHSVIAVPFYAMLAGRTLRLNGGRVAEAHGVRDWLKLNLRLLRISLVKGLVFLFLGLVLFVLSFFPVLNVLAVMAAMMILAFDVMDYSLEAAGLGFRERMAYMRGVRGQWFGMAAALALTLPLPGLTLLVIPGAVVGGALLFQEPRT